MSLEEQVPALAAQVTALAAQVAELQAREEIRELLCVYGFAADTGSAVEWSRTYAPDGVYEGFSTMRGRAAFARAIDDPDGAHKQQIESKGSLHTSGPVLIRVDGDQAWAEGPALVWIAGEAAWRPFSLTYNHWDLRRREGRWEVTHRRSRPVAPGQAAEVWTAWRSTVDSPPAPTV